jgi:ribonuclease P protein subunit RPR2
MREQSYGFEVLEVLTPKQIPLIQVKARLYFKGRCYLINVKAGLRDLVTERMQILIKNALANARSNPELAERQASLAKRLSTKYRVRMPYELRMNFCKKCKKFIVPGFTARIRLGRSAVKSIRITCGFCNHTYRKIIKNKILKVNDL